MRGNPKRPSRLHLSTGGPRPQLDGHCRNSPFGGPRFCHNTNSDFGAFFGRTLNSDKNIRTDANNATPYIPHTRTDFPTNLQICPDRCLSFCLGRQFALSSFRATRRCSVYSPRSPSQASLGRWTCIRTQPQRQSQPCPDRSGKCLTPG